MAELPESKLGLPDVSRNEGSAVQPAPPHPLDGSWYMNSDDKTYGPYTGHVLKGYIAEGRITPSTMIAPVGSDRWIRAHDDPAFRAYFPTGDVAAPPSRPSAVSAGEGATVVQVTNNIGNGNPAAQILLEGAAARKSAGLALVFSLLVPGLGQFYNGQIGKGILMFCLNIALWFVLLGWIIWIWSAVDAYQTAKKMNLRYYQILAGGNPVVASG